ncbi:MAG: acyloxyacyl hydrolase [Bacteroidales bacterium]|nr:acyloxyacyl hydrolase [Bacteroidales bacterium]
MKYKGLIFILLLALPFSLKSQSAHKLKFEIVSGILTPHYEEMKPIRQNPLAGALIQYNFSSSHSSVFDKVYKKPEYGIGFEYLNLGNPEMTGNAFSLYVHWGLHLFKNDKNALKLWVAPGAAYLSKFYHPENNPHNLGVSKHSNIYFKLAFSYEVFLNELFSLNIGSGITHFSNGATKHPNTGLNMVNFSLGTSYKFLEITENKVKTYTQKGFEGWLIGTIGKTDSRARGGKSAGVSFICNTISLGVAYKYNYIGKVGLSLDGIINPSDKHYWDNSLNKLMEMTDKDFIDYFRLGLSAGHEFNYKNFGFITYAGIYPYNKIKPNDWSYLRTGFRYYHKPLVLNASIKTVGFRAQYLEFGLGLYLNNHKKRTE